MPQYSSSFRNNIRRERIADDTFVRTLTINLTDYGTISPTDYEGNGDLVKRAYGDIINRTYDPNVLVQLNIPAGDYYFRGTADVNQSITFEPPQGGQIKIVGASRSGSRPLSTTLASQTKSQNYTSISTHWTTRFHFSNNGIYYKSQHGGTYGVGGFSNIAFFGTWNGSPGNQLATGTVDSRGFAGSGRLEYCAFHGFNGPSANSTGILADSSMISAYSVIVSNCNRGIQASTGGSFSSYSANTDSDRDVITNINEHGILAFNNGIIRLGTGAHIRNTGGYGAYAFSCSSISIEGSSISGNALSSVYAYPGTSSYIDTSTGAP
jgi:hypothetical protein